MDRLLRSHFLFILFLVQAMTISMANGHRKKPAFCNETQQSSSFLWKLLNREPPVYFFGTIHVPYTRVWDHVAFSAKKAFERADSVFFELDLSDPVTLGELANCQMLPTGETLSDVLPVELYRRLKSRMDLVKTQIRHWVREDRSGLFPEYLFKAIAGNWEKKRPIWVMLMINSLTESDVRTRGIPVLDLYLANEATRQGKRAGAVEKVEEQCLPLNGLELSQVLYALNQTLIQLESLSLGKNNQSHGSDELVKRYNCGDLNNFEMEQKESIVMLDGNSSTADELLLSRNMDSYFRRELIEKRNARMADRVLQLIRQYPDESFFFAFGAGHFLGNSSILEYVQESGYTVEEVAPDAKIKNFRRPHHHPRWRGPNETFNNDFNPSRSGEDSPRRRYRKRGHQHNGVQLLRTVATPAPSRGKHQQRNFNDLWVKMDTRDRSASQPSQEHSENFQRSSKKNSKTWYSVPSSTTTVQPHVFLELFWTVCFVVLWHLRQSGVYLFIY